jgi:hypothetical protein
MASFSAPAAAARASASSQRRSRALFSAGASKGAQIKILIFQDTSLSQKCGRIYEPCSSWVILSASLALAASQTTSAGAAVDGVIPDVHQVQIVRNKQIKNNGIRRLGVYVGLGVESRESREEKFEFWSRNVPRALKSFSFKGEMVNFFESFLALLQGRSASMEVHRQRDFVRENRKTNRLLIIREFSFPEFAKPCICIISNNLVVCERPRRGW